MSSKVNFPQMEEAILRLWRERDIFPKSVQQRAGRPAVHLLRGPPYANGSPGVHHVLARVFKDVIVRYKTMRGYRVPRKAGWDTHGLPVELEVESELGFTSKTEIEAYGVAEFNRRCRESVFRYLKEWEALTERIGFWVDLEDAYVTCDNDYIEIVLVGRQAAVGQGAGLPGLPGRRPTARAAAPRSPSTRWRRATRRTRRPLGVHQVPPDAREPGQGWRRASAGDEPTYLLAWTTTPWTLPGNTALAVAPEAEYAVVDGGRRARWSWRGAACGASAGR